MKWKEMAPIKISFPIIVGCVKIGYIKTHWEHIVYSTQHRKPQSKQKHASSLSGDYSGSVASSQHELSMKNTSSPRWTGGTRNCRGKARLPHMKV